MILRSWRGWVATPRIAEYVRYVERTGIAGYRATPGNLAAQIVTRDLGEGRTEVMTLSWWETLDDVIGFAADDIDQARFYPEDDDFLVDRETTVLRHEVASFSGGFGSDTGPP
ncbi:antibiotic biosynthesis monooxygenase [soil metagenome]